MPRGRGIRRFTRRDFIKTLGMGMSALPVAGFGLGALTGCGGGPPAPTPVEAVRWPISSQVLTTAQRQVCPVALPPATFHINPDDVAGYATHGYSAWNYGVGLAHVLRTDLAPGYAGTANVARLLYLFSMSDIHIADKESPAQPIYIGTRAGYGSGMSSAYSPVILSTPHVLDAAVQTINALHRVMPFDLGVVLGDAVNNTQYNELRWFIDTMDGRIIAPSSGANLGASAIDYQMPFLAAGLNPEIPWYQVIGNHDQFWMGSALEETKTRNAHIAGTILNMGWNVADPIAALKETGYYMGVVDGSTAYGDIVGAGPESEFETPPMVAADGNRHSVATPASTTLGFMREFFQTTSKPAGHGFTRSNLASGMACYSFVPNSDIPIKFIVLDDTVKGPDQPNYAAGALDDARYKWLVNELQAGQAADQLMVICAHVPIQPQTSLINTAPFHLWPGPEYTEDYVLNTLHQYPNLILWISGHRHVNVVTPQPAPSGDPTLAFWEVETCSLRDFPQQFRTFDIRRNSDNTVSIIITNVDPAVQDNSPAYKSRGYAIGAARVYGSYPLDDTTSHSYNAELVVQLTPVMQSVISRAGSAL